jgi:hypothetical protein
MKSRLAKKAFSAGYFKVWINHRNNKTIIVPRNARCWNVINKACFYYGHPEWLNKISESIVSSIEG